MKYCRQLLTCILAAALTLCPFVKETQAKELFDEEELFSYIDEDDFYLQAKRTPSIGAFGYHRMDGDEFAPYLLS